MSSRALFLVVAGTILSLAIPTGTQAAGSTAIGSCATTGEGVECEDSLDTRCCDGDFCILDFKKKAKGS